jgi:hypothetical protein
MHTQESQMDYKNFSISIGLHISPRHNCEVPFFYWYPNNQYQCFDDQ